MRLAPGEWSIFANLAALCALACSGDGFESAASDDAGAAAVAQDAGETVRDDAGAAAIADAASTVQPSTSMDSTPESDRPPLPDAAGVDVQDASATRPALDGCERKPTSDINCAAGIGERPPNAWACPHDPDGCVRLGFPDVVCCEDP